MPIHTVPETLSAGHAVPYAVYGNFSDNDESSNLGHWGNALGGGLASSQQLAWKATREWLVCAIPGPG